MSRHKWFQFDAETWLSDPKLKMVSYRAKGIWIDLICLCHLSERYGYLVINGSQMCQKSVRSVLNLTKADEKHFQTLVDIGILRQDEEGYFYCHKLLKDKAFKEKQKEHGKKGGNPTLKGSLNPSLKPEKKRKEQNRKDIKKSKPKKDFSSDQEKYKQALQHDHFKNPQFKELWENFCRYRGSQYTLLAKNMALTKLFRYEVTIGINSIENSLSNGYKGIFPEAVLNQKPNLNQTVDFAKDAKWCEEQDKLKKEMSEK